ncbi:MAG: LacI family DNA-binding transcriptional regulator [Flavobacteriaceae bacterium]
MLPKLIKAIKAKKILFIVVSFKILKTNIRGLNKSQLKKTIKKQHKRLRKFALISIFMFDMRRKKAGLKDLAEHLGVSVSTVSRSLKDHPDISESTKARVKQLAQELNYTPNLVAQSFRNQKSNLIGVIVPNISHDFTSRMLKGILDEGESNGFRVIILESNNSDSKQRDILKTMINLNVDGILMALCRRTTSVDFIIEIINTIPLVLFDKVSDKIPCSQVVIDDEFAAYHAVEHLINIGKKRIAIIKETENSYNSEKRFQGYKKALIEHNLPIDEKIILSTEDISYEKGRHMGNYLVSLKNRPDGLFSIADSAAIGAIKAFQQNGLNIPNDIAVVGFSNSQKCKFITPELSSIDQPGDQIGRVAMQTLTNEISINRDMPIVKTIEIKTNLKIRGSSLFHQNLR